MAMFNHTKSLTLCLLLAACLICSCSETNEPWAGEAPVPPPAETFGPDRTYDYTHKVVQKSEKGQLRITVAILRFGDSRDIEDVPFGVQTKPAENQSGQVNVNVNVQANEAPSVPPPSAPLFNRRAKDILKHTLVKSEAFTVVERERILEILREINFDKTRYVNPETAPAEGQIMAVRYLLEGSLGANEDLTFKDTLDQGKTYRDLPSTMNVFRPGAKSQAKQLAAFREWQRARFRERARQEFNSACYLHAYDVHTGEMAASVMGLGKNGLEAINDAVDELIEALSRLDNDIRVAATSGDKLYVDAGLYAGLQAGDRFQVSHRGEPIRDQYGNLIGYQEDEVGEIEIVDVKELFSIARVMNKSGTIERGDLAKPALH